MVIHLRSVAAAVSNLTENIFGIGVAAVPENTFDVEAAAALPPINRYASYRCSHLLKSKQQASKLK
jgi:hypothetical protein